MIKLHPSEVKIRTMTITCKTSNTLKYEYVCKTLDTSKEIKSIEYAKDGSIHVKGEKKPKKKKKDKYGNIKKPQLFFNQITIEVILDDDKIINCKVFTNGMIQMTGCRNVTDAEDASNIIVNSIKKIKGYENKNDVTISDYSIKMINSNFNIGDYKIDRYKLYEILNTKYRYMLSCFNPDKYPGVKIYYKYYQNEDMYNWNSYQISEWLHDTDLAICIPIFNKHNIDGNKLIKLCDKDLINMGIENFEIRDKFKKLMNNKEIIKKITLLIFRTGQIIITGANKINQLDIIYKFIIDLLESFPKILL
jgi:TATA-box binding protein (TBP) (component of TFIID and TFIIIB)